MLPSIGADILARILLPEKSARPGSSSAATPAVSGFPPPMKAPQPTAQGACLNLSTAKSSGVLSKALKWRARIQKEKGNPNASDPSSFAGGCGTEDQIELKGREENRRGPRLIRGRFASGKLWSRFA